MSVSSLFYVCNRSLSIKEYKVIYAVSEGTATRYDIEVSKNNTKRLEGRDIGFWCSNYFYTEKEALEILKQRLNDRKEKTAAALLRQSALFIKYSNALVKIDSKLKAIEP